MHIGGHTKYLALIIGLLAILPATALAQNTSANVTNSTNVTVEVPPLPCGIRGCIIIRGFVADFVPVGGTKLIKLANITIRIEPFEASTLNESGYDVRYRLPYWTTPDDIFVALPYGIAEGLDQTNFNALVAENGRLKGDLFFWQVIGILAMVYILGSYAYNFWQEYADQM